MDGLIPSGELADMQTLAASSLDIAGCVIQRAVVTATTSGHATEAFNTIATVNCGMAKPSAGLMAVYAGLIGDREAWVISLPMGTDVQRNDQLVVNGLTLRVEADITTQSYPVLTQVLAATIR